MVDIFIPTYKRKTFPALNFLNDKLIRLNLCVRSEEDDAGFYDELKRIDRINVIRLGYGLTDIGDTRQAILQHCIDNDIDFCPMFDDSVIRLYNRSVYGINEPSRMIAKLIDEIKQLDITDNVALGGFVTRRAYSTWDGTTGDFREFDYPQYHEHFFADFPSQAVILNVKVLKQHGISYHKIDEYGLEDCVFVADCLREGLVFYFNPSFRKDALAANAVKEGGNHTVHNSKEKIRSKYNVAQMKTYERYKDMMGIIAEARYRNYLEGEVFFVGFNWSYYRDVLVNDRNKNQDIIDSHLSYEEYKRRILA